MTIRVLHKNPHPLETFNSRGRIFVPIPKGRKPLEADQINELFTELRHEYNAFIGGIVAWGEAMKSFCQERGI